MVIRESGGDYLEAVLVLQKKKGMVCSIDLAQHISWAVSANKSIDAAHESLESKAE